MASESVVYTHGHHESVLRSHTWRTVANSAAYLLPHIKPNMKILDVGCGPGTITIGLARHVPDGHVVGVDFAPDVLEKARAAVAEHGVQNVRFEPGDVASAGGLPFPNGCFDIVHAHQVLQHVGDPVAALREMQRVARPGGGIVAARESDTFIWFPQTPGMDEWYTLYMSVARANGGEPLAGRRVHAWAREAGFAIESMACSVGTWCYSTREEVAWWGELWADRTLHSSMASTALKHGLATREDLERFAQAWREWTEDEDAWFCIPSGEVICRVWCAKFAKFCLLAITDSS